jgi:septum formation protein
MKIILASNSPRRQELLKGLDVDFRVEVKKGIDESYPEDMPINQVPEYLSMKKASAYEIGDDELLLTADTLVILDGKALGKPKDASQAKEMLRSLS